MNTPSLEIRLQWAIQAANQGEAISWYSMGKLLVEARDSMLSRDAGFASFSEWLKSFAKHLKLRPSNLWRYLSSTDHLDVIQDRLAQTKNEQFVNQDTFKKIGPESVELLYKISRVLEDEAFFQLAVKALEGHSTRSELRIIWESYRDILEGKTARGRDARAPFVDLQATDIQAPLRIAKVRAALLSTKPDWSNAEPFYYFKSYPDVVLPDISHQEQFKGILCIVVITMDPIWSNIKLHGIVVRNVEQLTADDMGLLQFAKEVCDFAWIATDGGVDRQVMDTLPARVGVLEVNTKAIVIRPATATQAKVEHVSQLGMSILSLQLRNSSIVGEPQANVNNFNS